MKEPSLLGRIFPWGPVLFGIGFIAPVIAEVIEAFEVSAPLGAPPIVVGLTVGILMGSTAKYRGSWL